jgi:hypothetical protein
MKRLGDVKEALWIVGEKKKAKSGPQAVVALQEWLMKRLS